MLKITRMDDSQNYKIDTYLAESPRRKPKLIFSVENLDITALQHELVRQEIDEDLAKIVVTRLLNRRINVAGFDDNGNIILG